MARHIPADGVVLDRGPSDHNPFICDFGFEIGSFRALTYNVEHGHDALDLADVFDAIEAVAPSVWLLQEIKRYPHNLDVVRDLRRRGLRVKYAEPEFAIAWDPAVWEYVRSWRPLMAPTKYWTTNYALVVVLRHKRTGRLGKFVTVHPPAHVQAPKHKTFTVVSRVLREWKVTLDRIARRNFNRRNERYGIDFVLTGGDENVALDKGWKPAGGWAFLTDGPLQVVDPPAGTRGNRKIDRFRVRGLVTRKKEQHR